MKHTLTLLMLCFVLGIPSSLAASTKVIFKRGSRKHAPPTLQQIEAFVERAYPGYETIPEMVVYLGSGGIKLRLTKQKTKTQRWFTVDRRGSGRAIRSTRPSKKHRDVAAARNSASSSSDETARAAVAPRKAREEEAAAGELSPPWEYLEAAKARRRRKSPPEGGKAGKGLREIAEQKAKQYAQKADRRTSQHTAKARRERGVTSDSSDGGAFGDFNYTRSKSPIPETSGRRARALSLVDEAGETPTASAGSGTKPKRRAKKAPPPELLDPDYSLRQASSSSDDEFANALAASEGVLVKPGAAQSRSRAYRRRAPVFEPLGVHPTAVATSTKTVGKSPGTPAMELVPVGASKPPAPRRAPAAPARMADDAAGKPALELTQVGSGKGGRTSPAAAAGTKKKTASSSGSGGKPGESDVDGTSGLSDDWELGGLSSDSDGADERAEAMARIAADFEAATKSGKFKMLADNTKGK